MFQETEETVNRWSCDKELSFYSAERCARNYDELLTDRTRNRDRVLTIGGKASLDLYLWEERWEPQENPRVQPKPGGGQGQRLQRRAARRGGVGLCYLQPHPLPCVQGLRGLLQGVLR